MIKKLMITFSVAAVLISGGASMASEYTVYVVRHAEKAIAESDPPLNEQGQARATLLAQMLSKAQIMAVYSTPYQRTQQTAKPLAEQLGLSVQSYKPAASESLVARVHEQAENTLVVGHSNTVPSIVRQFGFEVADLTEQDYGDLYVIHINDEKRSLLRFVVPAFAP